MIHCYLSRTSDKCIDCGLNEEFVDFKNLRKILQERTDLRNFKEETYLPKDILLMINNRIPISKSLRTNCSISTGICCPLYHTHCLHK